MSDRPMRGGRGGRILAILSRQLEKAQLVEPTPENDEVDPETRAVSPIELGQPAERPELATISSERQDMTPTTEANYPIEQEQPAEKLELATISLVQQDLAQREEVNSPIEQEQMTEDKDGESSSSDSGFDNPNIDTEILRGLADEKFKKCVIDAMGGKPKSTYVTAENILLENCIDEEPWMPNQVLEWIKQDQEVELIDKSVNTDYNYVMNHLKEHSDNIGLTAIAKRLSRFDEIYMIVLTTTEKIFAMPPTVTNIHILKDIVKKKYFRLHTTNLLQLSDAFRHHYKIIFNIDRVFDVNCAHVALRHQLTTMTSLQQRNYRVRLKDLKNTANARFESLADLCNIHFGIEAITMMYSEDQLAHLKLRPLNLTAINVIKKASILILPLSKEINYQYFRPVRELVGSTIEQYSELTDRALRFALNDPNVDFRALTQIASGIRN